MNDKKMAAAEVSGLSNIAQIPDILDDKFDGWREMPGRTHQLSLLAK